jgi:hypothetical protein
MKNLYKNKLIKVVTWIAVTFKGDSSIPLHEVIDFIQRLDKVCKSNGEQQALAFVKSLREAHVNYLSGDIKPVKGVRLTGDGIPVFLGKLIPLIRGSSMLAITLVNTVLWASRSLKIGKDPDISSIIAAPKKEYPNEVGMYMGSF